MFTTLIPRLTHNHYRMRIPQLERTSVFFHQASYGQAMEIVGMSPDSHRRLIEYCLYAIYISVRNVFEIIWSLSVDSATVCQPLTSPGKMNMWSTVEHHMELDRTTFIWRERVRLVKHFPPCANLKF